MDVLTFSETRANLKSVMDQVVNDQSRRDPFRGLGKLEPLKNEFQGWWSRGIDKEHRIVYRVSGSPPDRIIEIVQCRFHY